MTERKRTNTRAERTRNARILAASDTCHLCGHPDADAVDHVEPWVACVARGVDPDRPDNLKPAHHNTRCPTCGHRCNREKGDRPYAPVVRRSGSLR